MENNNIIITLRYNVNLDRGVVRQRLPVEFGTGDKEAHKIILTACRATGVVDLTGAGVMAYINRNDGTSVIVDGTVEDGKAVVILPEACYAVNGAVSIAVKITMDESRTTALWLDGHINRTSNDTLVDPGNVVPSLESLLAEIDNMRAATDEAEAVTENAQAVVDSYNGTVASQNSSITDLRKRTGDLESAIGIRASSGKNLLNPADIVEGQWSTGGTTLTPGSEYISYAHRIPVKGGTTYTISNDGVAEGMKVATLTEFAADGSRPGISQYWADTTFTTAATTVELLISLEATWDKPQLEEGSVATAYEPYSDHVASRMQDEIDELEKVVEGKADKPLLGGKICTYGDSLAANDDGNRSIKTWIDYAAEQLGCARAYNRGVGSTTVTAATKDGTPRTGYVYVDAEGDAGEVRGMYTTPRTFAGYPNEVTPWMCTEQRIATIPEDTDAVVIIAGTNDVGTTTVDGFAEAYGQMLTLMAQLRPAMRIYTCTLPFQQTYDMGSAADVAAYNAYRGAIRRVSAEHGVPCIDLLQRMGVNADNYADYMNDATHYNTEAGRKMIASCVYDALMTICGYAGKAGLAVHALEADHATDADTVKGVDVIAQIAKNAEDTAAVSERVCELSEEKLNKTTAIEGYEFIAGDNVEMIEASRKASGKYRNADGVEASSSAWEYYTIPVQAGEIYRVKAFGQGPVQGALQVGADGAVLSKHNTVNADTYTEVAIVDGATTMYVNNKPSELSTPSVLKSGTDMYKRIENDEPEKDIQYYTVKTKIEEMIQSAAKTSGKYMSASAVEGSSSAWEYYSLPVTGGDTYRVASAGQGSVKGVVEVNAAGSVVATHDTVSDSYAEIVLNGDAVKIYINNRPAELATPSVVKVSGEWYEYTGQPKQFDRLAGKKLVVCGNSITAATNPDGGKFANYGKIVAGWHGMTYAENARSGSTMANVAGKEPFCVDRYLQVPSDFDYLTIWFGWNDASYSALGTIDDTDDTTFYGAYKKVLEYFVTSYPTKKIGIVVPYGDFPEYQQAVRNLSKMFGVPCLDLPNSNQCSMIWGKDNAAQLARREALTYDGLHPNQAGYDFLATIFEQFLLSL